MTRTILKTLSLAVVMAATAAFAQANAMNREGANLGTSACTRARWLGMLALRFLFLGLALSECEIANGAGRLAKIAGLFRSADNSGQPDPAGAGLLVLSFALALAYRRLVPFVASAHPSPAGRMGADPQ